MKNYAEQIRSFIPKDRTYKVLGTDGFGRSDFRSKLREHFEINRHYIVVAALKALSEQGSVPVAKVAKGKATKKTGTTITFFPDATIFVDTIEFKFDRLATRLRELAFLNPGITIELIDERGDSERKAVFFYEEGIVEFAVSQHSRIGGNDRPAPPGFCHIGDIHAKALIFRQFRAIGVAQQIKPFGQRLHHAVFNAVMDHLDEVARTVRAHVCDAGLAFGNCGDGGENWPERLVSLSGATGHD